MEIYNMGGNIKSVLKMTSLACLLAATTSAMAAPSTSLSKLAGRNNKQKSETTNVGNQAIKNIFKLPR